MAIRNFEIKILVDTPGTDAISGLWGYEWYWSTSSTDPTAGTAAMKFGTAAFLGLGLSDYGLADVNLYVWCRSVDRAGNKSSWTRFGGGAGVVDIEDRDIAGGYTLKDLLVMA